MKLSSKVRIFFGVSFLFLGCESLNNGNQLNDVVANSPVNSQTPTPGGSTSSAPAPTPSISTPTTSMPTGIPGPVPTKTTAPSPTPSSSAGVAMDSEEWGFLDLINSYRLQNSAPALQVSFELTQTADWMSTDMAVKNYFSHTDSLGRSPFDRMSVFGYIYSAYSGENIAAGNAAAQATFTQWKNSSGHDANMLMASYLAIGISRVYDASSDYGWYWTTDFGSYVDTVIQRPSLVTRTSSRSFK